MNEWIMRIVQTVTRCKFAPVAICQRLFALDIIEVGYFRKIVHDLGAIGSVEEF